MKPLHLTTMLYYAANLLDFKDLVYSSLPFGGKTVVLGGNFSSTPANNYPAACIEMGRQWQLFSVNTFDLFTEYAGK